MRLSRLRALIATGVVFLACMPVARAEERFVRGDANIDAKVDIADAIFVLGYLFAHGKTPACPDAADVNDDGKLDIGDAVRCLGFLFSGKSLPAPSPGCGADPTIDAFGVCAYRSASCSDSREERAQETTRAFLASFLDGTAQPDAALLAASFGVDGYGGVPYLDAFWTADDALSIGDEGGVELIYRVSDASFYFYDMLAAGVVVPADNALPVLSELSIEGALIADEMFAALCESRASFFLQEVGAAMQIVAPGPRWESEVQEPLPAVFAFFPGAIRVDGAAVYAGTPAREFVVSSLERAAGASLAIEVEPLAPAGMPAGALADLRVTARLFSSGSPTAALYAGSDEIELTQTWTGVAAGDAPTFPGTLRLPSDLAAGWYSLVVVVESLSAGVAYATERVTLPLRVAP